VSPVAYDAKSALLVVDVQNDFADPAGSLAVRGAEALVPRINEEIARANELGALVVYTQDWHPEVTPHFAKDGGIWPVHCVGGTWGAELHPDLVVVGERIRKGQHGEDGYSAFTMRDPLSGETQPTELEELLRSNGIEWVMVCGIATDYCVKESVLDARRLGFETTVLTDAVAAVDLQPRDGERALGEMAEVGAALV
jgi:nicotinamidase/pyrazinamidase